MDNKISHKNDFAPVTPQNKTKNHTAVIYTTADFLLFYITAECGKDDNETGTLILKKTALLLFIQNLNEGEKGNSLN